jgi:antitoxin MazE
LASVVIATISRWGNSLGIRIPKSALEKAQLHEGDQVDVVAEADGRLVMCRKVSRRSLDDLVAEITPDNRHGDAFPDLTGNELW